MTTEGRKPSVLLLGSKPGAVAALETMHTLGWDIRHVVTSGESTHAFIEAESLSQASERLGYDVTSVDRLDEKLTVDFVISYMYRNLVKPRELNMAARAALNFHAGPLPEYGGWAFYNIAILEGATEYGCTCHYMDEGFDTGPLLEVRRFPIDPQQETAWSLERKAQVAMSELFVDFCHLAEAGEPLPSQPQDPSRHRYLTRSEFTARKQIPADSDAETVDRYARAFWYPPYEGAYILRADGSRVEVVPALAKTEVARRLHDDDLSIVRAAAQHRHTEHKEGLL